MKISAVVIAKNEALNIADCLKSVSFADEVVVVDGGSSDDTCSIASKSGALVFLRTFDDFASQKNFAVSKAQSPWVFLVDADERVSDELREEILRSISGCADSVSAFAIPRLNVIFGKVLKYGENAGDFPIRLFRKDEALWEGVVHERVKAKNTVLRLKSPLMHYSTRDANQYMRKLNLYTKLEADVLYDQKYGFRRRDMTLRPFLKLLKRYFIQRGCFDGRRGFLYIVFGTYYEFIRYAKLWEILRSSSDNIND